MNLPTINLMKILDVLVSLKGISNYLYKLYLILEGVLHLSSFYISI
jgi:hypothetical protein